VVFAVAHASFSSLPAPRFFLDRQDAKGAMNSKDRSQGSGIRIEFLKALLRQGIPG